MNPRLACKPFIPSGVCHWLKKLRTTALAPGLPVGPLVIIYFSLIAGRKGTDCSFSVSFPFRSLFSIDRFLCKEEISQKLHIQMSLIGNQIQGMNKGGLCPAVDEQEGSGRLHLRTFILVHGFVGFSQ